MSWWMWIILGFVFMLAEFLTAGAFYIIFVGAAAVVVGFLSLVGLAGPEWFEWLLFTALSVASVALFRKRLRNRLEIPPLPDDVDTIVGKIVLVIEPIGVGSVGRVEMHGTAWSAKNLGGEPLTSGQSATVEKLEGLILGVRGDE